MKAQQFAIGESLTVEDLAEDQVGGTKGWGLYPRGCQPPEAVLGVTIVLFVSLSKYIAIYSDKTRRCTGRLGSDHLIGQISAGDGGMESVGSIVLWIFIDLSQFN